MAPRIKACYSSTRRAGNVVRLTDRGISCPFRCHLKDNEIFSAPLFPRCKDEYGVQSCGFGCYTQSEIADSVKEALSVIKKWNPDWAPKHFMVDYAEEEIPAVEDLFPGTVEMSGSWKYRGFFACLFVLLLLFVEIYFRNIPDH